MVRYAQHRQIVESVEVVFRQPAFPDGLRERNQGSLVSKITDQAAKIRVRISDLADIIDHFPVVDTEAGDVLDQRRLGKLIDNVVVQSANHEEHWRLRASAF